MTIVGFFGFLLVVFLIHWYLVPPGGRAYFLLFCSVLFAGLLSARWVVFFILNIFIVYFSASLIRQVPLRKKAILTTAICWLFASMCFFKYTKILSGCYYNSIPSPAISGCLLAQNIFWPLGFSYIFFRLVHYLVEAYRAQAPSSTLGKFALYVFFFPTFLAGPIERFERFYPQISRKESLTWDEVNAGLWRILLGLVKKLIVADRLRIFLMPILSHPEIYNRFMLSLAIYSLVIQIYMDFSGYVDMAIGSSRLFGYRIVENFNKPFLKTNIADFWRSWHISLYTWIRDYVFYPFFGTSGRTVKLYLGIFFSFFLFMMWHNLTWNFFIFGIYNGLGVVFWQLFQEFKRKRPALQKALGHRWLTPLAVGSTLSFVSFGAIFLYFDMKISFRIIGRFFGF